MAKVKEKEAPTGKTLAEIAADRQTLDEFLLENEGELTPELEELLADNSTEADVKIVAVAAHIDEQEEFAEGIKRRGNKLLARSGAIVRRMDWLKNAYLARALVTLNKTLAGDRIDGEEAVVRVQLNNPRLDPPEISEETAIAMFGDVATMDYVKRTVTYSVDRVALLTAAKQSPEFAARIAERYKLTIVRDASVRIA